MKLRLSSRSLVMVAGLFLASQVLTAQNTIQLFSAVNVRNSPSTTTYSNLYTFNSSTVSMTCPTTGISAALSGPAMNGDGTAPTTDGSGNLQPGGKLLSDNVFLFTVTPQGGSPGTAINACAINHDGIRTFSYAGQTIPTSPTDLTWNCFTSGYGGVAGTLVSENANPDTTIVPNGTKTVDAAGGVSPVDISTDLVAGQQSVNFALVDGGGILAGSSIFLQTNCTINGVSGGTAGGNPINGSHSQGTSQTFTFNPNINGEQGVQFQYDVTGALNTLTNHTDGSIPQVSDAAVDPSTFQSVFVPGTSFSTANCIVHSGEVLADGVTPACKLYTLLCLNPSDSTLAGANCPWSSQANEVVRDLFDGPQFTLYDIHGQNGGVIHEGIGFLMANDIWPGVGVDPSKTNCTFDSNSGSGVADLPCPQNLLTSFSGPGAFNGTGLTLNPNSEFISVYGVPLDKTAVTVSGQTNGSWVNTGTPTINFVSHAPDLTSSSNGKYPYINIGNVKSPVPGASDYRPQPIKSITYGISPLGSVPNPLNEPIANDITLTNQSAGCAPGPLSQLSQPDFVTSDTVSSGSALTDGQYLIHFYAQDCAGTQELLFTMAPGTGVWSTNFYTYPLNVDTIAPAVNITSPTGTPTYTRNQTVYASYSCTDAGQVQGGPNTGSGVVKCGTSTFGVGTTFSTGTLQTKLSTSSTGDKSYTVTAVDGAGNTSSQTIYYTVTN